MTFIEETFMLNVSDLRLTLQWLQSTIDLEVRWLYTTFFLWIPVLVKFTFEFTKENLLLSKRVVCELIFNQGPMRTGDVGRPKNQTFLIRDITLCDSGMHLCHTDRTCKLYGPLVICILPFCHSPETPIRSWSIQTLSLTGPVGPIRPSFCIEWDIE